ncbi:MAG TPA: WecB/TagA/CpsF family glycosyltransferase [Solirubrobacteraceae bacterium]|jgi:N-acetylglucosaminyldiphosphoundecaprenol N-acetyl-beta-D-mannosaminyltransferase|nr:WecB/TagA/CpsF family glycosyltransferase [Solirubrobacteraceae bacterium]
MHDTVNLRALPFAALTETQTVNEIMRCRETGGGGWVSTPNTHQLDLITRHGELRSLVESASLIVADGMPLVWASALQGTPLPERVAGSNLVWSLARAAADEGASLFLLGGDAGVARRAKLTLEREVPGLRVVGAHSPPFGFESNPAEISRIREQLQAARPDFVYVGLGFPKQELLIRELTECLPETWFLGVGISLSFISGDRSRAPAWMQRLGLEWVHRLWLEPSRLFRRYLVDGVPFTVGLLLRCGVTRVKAPAYPLR